MGAAGKQNRQEQILRSLDGMEKAPAPDFFYARLMARIQREKEAGRPAFILLRPSFLITGMCLVCVMNLVMLLNKQKHSGQGNATGGIENFASEYGLSGNNQLY